MKNGKCVKCGAESVRMARNGLSDQSMHTTMWPHFEGRPRGIVRPQQGQVTHFACTQCGYIEQWILDPATLQYVEENWAPVAPSS